MKSRRKSGKIFEKSKVRNQPMVQKEILPRLMRRFATSGGEKNYLICAKLINLCNNDIQKNAVMSGFEKAFEGGSLPSLPSSANKLKVMVKTNKKYLNFMLQILSDRFGQLNKKKFINYVLTLPFFLSLIDWGVTSTSSSSSINSKACSNVFVSSDE